MYRTGLGRSTRENAGAFAFSIMITSVFGVVGALDPHPRWWEVMLFAVGGVAGFSAVAGLGQLVDDPEQEAERTDVVLLASALSIFSVVAAVAAAALVGWLASGFVAWLVGPFAGTTTFLLLNGLEYAAAQSEEDGNDDQS